MEDYKFKTFITESSFKSFIMKPDVKVISHSSNMDIKTGSIGIIERQIITKKRVHYSLIYLKED
jgi:hypothetical protein